MKITKHKFISNTPKVGFFKVTPTEAAFYLQNHNTHNRRLNEPVVLKFSQEIKNGAWRLTNQGLGFSKVGTIIDGQHRLAACVNANQPIEILIAYGLEGESQMKIDSGSVRTHLQRLLLGGQSIQRIAYRVAYNLCRLDHNWQWSVADSIVEDKIREKADILNYIISKVDNKECPRAFKRVGFLTAVAVYLEKNEKKAKEFFEQVISDGDGLGKITALARSYLSETRSSNGGLAQEDYVKIVQLIHLFHADIQDKPKKLSGKDSWDF